jgi:hypothetical protein
MATAAYAIFTFFALPLPVNILPLWLLYAFTVKNYFVPGFSFLAKLVFLSSLEALPLTASKYMYCIK